jgi:hypothetical protein
MPEKQKNKKDELSMQQKRLSRFSYNEDDVRELFGVKIEETLKKSNIIKKNTLIHTKK